MSQQLIAASISAILSRARLRAQRTSLQFSFIKSASAIAFQCPGGVYVPAPSAQNCTVAIWSRLGFLMVLYAASVSAESSALPVAGGGPGRRETITAESHRKPLTFPKSGNIGGLAGVSRLNQGIWPLAWVVVTKFAQLAGVPTALLALSALPRAR